MLLGLLTGLLLLGSWSAALGWLPFGRDAVTGTALLASVLSVAALGLRPLAWLPACAVAAAAWGALLAPQLVQPLPDPFHAGLARVALSISRSGCGTRGCWAEAELLACTPVDQATCVAVGTRLGVASEGELPRGAQLTALVKLRLRAAFENPAPTSRWPDTRPRVFASLAPGTTPRVDRLSTLGRTLASARSTIRAIFVRSLDPLHAGIARALLLGEGSAVEPELNASIRAAGVSHVLAVSGMHVTLLVGALVAAVRHLWLRTPLALYWEARRAAATLGACLAPLLASLCGSSASAVRAAWTSTLVYALTAAGLRPDLLSVSALVVILFALLSPLDALHPGFVLSVLATAGLLTHQAQPGGAVLAAARESLRAWLATALFLAVCFQQVSWVALLANVALLPLGTALVPLVAIHVIGEAAGLSALLPTGELFELASGAFLAAARLCAELDPGLPIPPFSPLQVVTLTCLTASFMVPLPWRARLKVSLCALVVLGSCELAIRLPLRAHELRVTFLDVGQGDAILLESGTGETALIDAGGSIGGGPDPGAAVVVPALRARRIDRLDWVALSHPHPDHYGGLSAVLAAVHVGELWDTGQGEDEQPAGAVADLLDQARAQGARIVRPASLCGHPLAFGPARLEVLAPCPEHDLTLEPNDNSFVFRLVHGQRSFLFTGDSEAARERLLVSAASGLESDVLKVAHHGSRTSTASAFLRSVAPVLAVISSGRGNPFGHPHSDVLTRLGASVPHVLRTDRLGGVEVTSDGRSLRTRTVAGARLVLSPATDRGG